MPNWCSNKLTVTGDAADVNQFIADNKEPNGKSDLTFEYVVPVPDPIKNDPSKSGRSHVDWANNNWGTKWDVDATVERDGDTCAVYTFDSAWSPPVEWVHAASAKYPSITFRLWYAEGGVDFGGVLELKNEEVQEIQSYSYRKAMLVQYGELADDCEACGEPYPSEEESPAHSLCDSCYEKRCVHCDKDREDHANGQCLFDTTKFKSRKDADGEQP
jgi:hypothetical protein